MIPVIPDEPAFRFSLVGGGPFNSLLTRMGLTGADRLPTWRAALLLTGLAWLLPGLLAVAQSVIKPDYAGWGYFSDWMAYTRYLIAIWIMVATERYADSRLALLAEHFGTAGIVGGPAGREFRAALAAAGRRSSSGLAEAVIVLAVLAWAGVSTTLTVDMSDSGWAGQTVQGQVVLSWAGEAARFVSTPLFLFLVLRWIWRFLAWTLLLYRISRLPLQLTPLHPDGCAGLGFLSIYPSIFTGVILALSSVVASGMIEDIQLRHPAADLVWLAMAIWVGLCFLLMLGPLLVFLVPLYRLRERALIDYGRVASQHHMAFQRRWIDPSKRGEDLLGSDDPSSASDLNAIIETVQRLRFVPVDRPALQQLTLAAGVPMLAVAATQIPLAEMGQWLLSKFF